MPPDTDVIVVGSGPSGVQAAQTLVESGCSVLMLDVGFAARAKADDRRSFAETRRVDTEQHHTFLGEDFSGVPLLPLGAAPQVTPPRRHVLAQPTGHTPVASTAFAALESHALGGLGAAWGAVSFPYLDVELERSGLPVAAMRRSYERVAERIGVSGAADDLLEVRGPLQSLQPALPADHNAAALLHAYERRREAFRRNHLFAGRPLMAVLSEAKGDRAPHAGGDMDFWSNPGGSVYRPEQTVRLLQQRANFKYCDGWRVETFAEDSSGVSVTAQSADGAHRREFRARRLVLGAGALGTARIVLRSLRRIGEPVPLVCNAHLYIPALHLRQLGLPHAARCHSLAQLTLIHDPTGDRSHLVQAQMYSYRSLLLFRLLKELPVAAPEAAWIARALAPSLVIWAVEHEDEPTSDSFCRLRGDGVLEAVHPTRRSVESQRRQVERALMRGMRRLGSWPLRRVYSGHGSSLHYGGPFPFSERDAPVTTDRDSRLRGTRAVHVVDGAALRYLPAKGLTFTLMANADRVGQQVAAGLNVSAQLSPKPRA